MKLTIYYLHFDTSQAPQRDRPHWFNFENCLKSLLMSLKNKPEHISIKINMVFDGTVESFDKNFVSRYFDRNQVTSIGGIDQEVIFVSAGTGAKATQQVLNLIKHHKLNHENEELIYVLENDYLHMPNWIDQLSALYYSGIPFDYVTLYDHADKYPLTQTYHRKYDSLRSKIYLCHGMYWRTTPSTCFSFIAKGKQLQADTYFFKRMRDKTIFPFLKFAKGRTLLSALPGLATHCVEHNLSPVIDWESINSSTESCKLDS